MKLQTPSHWVEPLEKFALYLRAAGQSENTITRRRQDLEQVAREVCPAGPQLITGEMLVSWAGAQQWAQETRRGRRASARVFWRWALDNGYASENAAAALPSVPASRPHPRPVPDRIYHPAVKTALPRVALMLKLAAVLGLRRAEIALIHVGHDLIRTDRGFQLVVHGKGSKDATVPVPINLGFEIARGAPGHSPGLGYSATSWLFPGDDDGHLSPRWVGHLCAQQLQAHQSEDELPWTGHKCRHRFGTRVYEASGRDILVTRDALRHGSVATTQIYCAVEDDAVAKAIENAAA